MAERVALHDCDLVDAQGFRVRGFAANSGVNQSTGIHEAIPITNLDSVNATARWRRSSINESSAISPPHSIKELPEGRYMVRVFLAGTATLYSLTFSEDCAPLVTSPIP